MMSPSGLQSTPPPPAPGKGQGVPVEITPRPRDPTLILLDLEAEIRSQRTDKELVFHLLNESKRILPFRQAFAFERRHEAQPFQVTGVSSLAAVDRNVPLMRWIERVVNARPGISDSAELQTFDRSAFGGTEEAEATTYPFDHALWVPLRATERAPLAGVLFFNSVPWGEGPQKIAQRLGATYSHAWDALAGPPRPWHRWRIDRRARWLIAAALLIVCIFPVSMSALAPMEISAADPAVVAAPLTGVVADILVPPNALVKANQPILRFEDTKLRNELELAQRRMQVASARFSSTAQAAIDSSEANRDVAINKAEYELASAQYNYAKDLLDKSVLRAPVDGVAVYTDRRDWQGKPVETGQQIMKVADPTQTEFSILLPVQDSLLIDEGARVKIYLDSDPLRPLAAHLVRSSYQAEKTESGGFAFRMVARADAPQPGLRIGTRGTAQVYGGKVPFLFYLLRRPITVIRQSVGL
ncbi:MAG: HlyD family efflux transporter periplasmic adaptor subunit [Comamonadaceae bacterium]|nr:MAG: HlyD family efflux transporter periplasmic adaptor subunit [Comamonadaceae bacterium]